MLVSVWQFYCLYARADHVSTFPPQDPVVYLKSPSCLRLGGLGPGHETELNVYDIDHS